MKMSMGSAALYARASWDRPSRLAHRAKRLVAPRKLTEPVKIETTGLRWLAVLTGVACERRVADELDAIGFKAYCPLGRKLIHWQGGRQLKQKLIREFPVFSRYIFVGVPRGLTLGRHLSEKIISILGDSFGPIIIPPAAIARINALELSGEWDAVKYKPQDSPYQPGTEVKIPRGPYAGFLATVDAQESETRLRVLVTMFGQRLAVPIDVDQVELVA